MSTTVVPEVAPVSHDDIVAKISWKMPITYVLGTLITLFTALESQGEAVYKFTLSRSDRFQVPNWTVDAAMLCWILTAVMAALSVYSIYRALWLSAPVLLTSPLKGSCLPELSPVCWLLPRPAPYGRASWRRR